MAFKIDRVKATRIGCRRPSFIKVNGVTTPNAIKQETLSRCEESFNEPIYEMEINGSSSQASPSPQLPQPINLINNLKVSGVKQLVNKDDIQATETINGVTFTNNVDGSVTINGTATSNTLFKLGVDVNNIVIGNKYFCVGTPIDDTEQLWNKICMYSNMKASNPDKYLVKNAIITCDNTPTSTLVYSIRVGENCIVNNVTIYPQLFDITSLNTTDLAEVKQILSPLLRNNYIPQQNNETNTTIPELLNGDKMVTFRDRSNNVWDEEWEVNSTGLHNKNRIYVKQNSNYYFLISGYNSWCAITFFDKDNNNLGNVTIFQNNPIMLTPNNCNYLIFQLGSSYGTTYNHDISILPIESSNISMVSGTFSSSTGAFVSYATRLRTNYIKCLPSKNYYIKTPKTLKIAYYNVAKGFISVSDTVNQGVITTPNNAYYCVIGTYDDYGTTYNNDISINKAFYQHYGAIMDKCVKWKKKIKLNLASLNYNMHGSLSNWFYCGLNSLGNSYKIGSDNVGYCNIYSVYNSTIWDAIEDKKIGIDASDNRIIIKDSDCSSVAELLTTLQNAYLYYDAYYPTTEVIEDSEWEEVDLGSLNWSYNSQYGLFNVYFSSAERNTLNSYCSIYTPKIDLQGVIDNNMSYVFGSDGTFWIHNSSYTDANTFKTAMQGVKLYYQPNTPKSDTTPTTPILTTKTFKGYSVISPSANYSYMQLDGALPIGYKELNCLSSNGSQYITLNGFWHYGIAIDIKYSGKLSFGFKYQANQYRTFYCYNGVIHCNGVDLLTLPTDNNIHHFKTYVKNNSGWYYSIDGVEYQGSLCYLHNAFDEFTLFAYCDKSVSPTSYIGSSCTIYECELSYFTSFRKLLVPAYQVERDKCVMFELLSGDSTQNGSSGEFEWR